MIEGAATLDELDMLDSRASPRSPGDCRAIPSPGNGSDGSVLGHAKLFFDDIAPAANADETLAAELKFTDPKLRNYLLLFDRGCRSELGLPGGGPGACAAARNRWPSRLAAKEPRRARDEARQAIRR
jgi:hypothetical protein